MANKISILTKVYYVNVQSNDMWIQTAWIENVHIWLYDLGLIIKVLMCFFFFLNVFLKFQLDLNLLLHTFWKINPKWKV